MGKILIIEDDVDQAELYRLSLEHQGHQVLRIVSDFPGKHQWKGEVPDLVILDERLRGRSGRVLIPSLRKTFPEVRILMLTADPVSGSIDLTVPGPANPGGYRLYRDTDKRSIGRSVHLGHADAAELSDDGTLRDGELYFYRVRSLSECN